MSNLDYICEEKGEPYDADLKIIPISDDMFNPDEAYFWD